MKVGVAAILVLWMLLYASGCGMKAADDAASSGLPVVKTSDVAEALAELCGSEDNSPALSGAITSPAYLADLNTDGKYELYAYAIDISETASSLIVGFVQCYDPVSGSVLSLSDGRAADYRITEYEGALYIIVQAYDGSEATVYRPALTDGKLTCRDVETALEEKVLAAQRNGAKRG